MDDHWLVRPDTVRRLWIAFIAVLAALILLDVLRHEAHFALEALFAFGAWFGFLSCVALILFAKALGFFLKRPDTYYDD
jgi:hypothetical protein